MDLLSLWEGRGERVKPRRQNSERAGLHEKGKEEIPGRTVKCKIFRGKRTNSMFIDKYKRYVGRWSPNKTEGAKGGEKGEAPTLILKKGLWE